VTVYTRQLGFSALDVGFAVIYTAPEDGTTTVIRDINVSTGGIVAPAFLDVVIGPIGEFQFWSFTFTSAPLTGGTNNDRWEGRQVLPPGWRIQIHPSTDLVGWIFVTGYVLS